MPNWEYETFTRARGFKGSLTSRRRATDWNWDITSELKRLGGDGWELVAVVPRSSIASEDVGGFTTDELWIFKRPLQDT